MFLINENPRNPGHPCHRTRRRRRGKHLPYSQNELRGLQVFEKSVCGLHLGLSEEDVGRLFKLVLNFQFKFWLCNRYLGKWELSQSFGGVLWG